MTETSHRDIGRDTLIYLPGRIVPAVMIVITVPVLTHFFSAYDVGRYDLALRLVMFLCTFGAFWLSTMIMRFYPAYEQRGELEAFHRVVAAARLASILLGLVGLAAAWAMGPDRLFGSYRDLLGIAGGVFVSQSLFETGLAMIRAKGRPARFSVASVANAVVRLPLGIGIALYFTRDISGMLWGTAVVTLAVYLLLMRRDFSYPRLRLNASEKAALRETAAYGLPIAMALMLNFFLGNADRYLLKYYRSDAEVGAFSIASLLVDQPIGTLFQTLMLAVFPTVSAVYEAEGRDATEHLVGRLTRVYLLLAVPAGVLFSVLAYPIMQVLPQREEFRQAYTVAPWLALASVTYGLHYYATFGLHLARRSEQLLLVTLISIAVNLVGNWYTVPAHGYNACGIVRLVSNAVLVIAVAAFSRRYLRWVIPWNSLGRIALAAAITGVCLHMAAAWLPVNLLTLGALLVLGATLYAAALLLTREVSFQEALGVFGRTSRNP
jgi:O-antigen/teichoic acid export membrane protein